MKNRTKNIPLGVKAVDIGFMSNEEIETSLVEQKKRQNDGQDIRLGELLVEQGNITGKQLETLLEVSALDKVKLTEEAIQLAIGISAKFEEEKNLLLFSDMNNGHNAANVASQVAHALTLICGDQQVLLIDANIHNPFVHQIFSVPLSPGLSEVMTTSVSLDSAINSTCVNNLSVLSAGKIDPLIVSRLISRGFRILINDVKNNYSIVVIHGSNLVDRSEAVLLASEVSQVIVVAEQGKITKSELRSVNKIVSGVNTHFSGVILCKNMTKKPDDK